MSPDKRFCSGEEHLRTLLEIHPISGLAVSPFHVATRSECEITKVAAVPLEVFTDSSRKVFSVELHISFWVLA